MRFFLGQQERNPKFLGGVSQWNYQKLNALLRIIQNFDLCANPPIGGFCKIIFIFLEWHASSHPSLDSLVGLVYVQLFTTGI